MVESQIFTSYAEHPVTTFFVKLFALLLRFEGGTTDQNLEIRKEYGQLCDVYKNLAYYS